MATFFSFGGGVQSCAIAALLIHESERLPKPLPDLILFADTGAEPPRIYEIIAEVFGLLAAAGFRCEVVRAKDANGEVRSILATPQDKRGGLATPPWFVHSENGIGMIRRQCTSEYKIKPLQQRMREFLGYKSGQRIKGIHNVWLGISVDEIRRAKPSQNKWEKNIFPLIELGMDRTRAFTYATTRLQIVPEKSACIMCPFIAEKEWLRRKQYAPEIFQAAVDIDNQIRTIPPSEYGLKAPPYILRNCTPLEQIPDQPALFDAAGLPSRTCEEAYCWV